MDKLKTFITQRMVAGTLLAVAILWLFSTIMGILDQPNVNLDTDAASRLPTTTQLMTPGSVLSVEPNKTHSEIAVHPVNPAGQNSNGKSQAPDTGHAITDTPVEHNEQPGSGSPVHDTVVIKHVSGTAQSHGAQHTPPADEKKIPGVAFVQAAQQPLRYELEERFWGWRPNDIINVTDNVNNYQLGVLEVTRRTAVILAERLSRTGSVESFDKNLEHAMDWFMTKPDRYWFPSPENRYIDALDDWAIYMEKLKRGQASFYTRSDNLIPLLAAYASLLGSCDENLVKTKEGSGDPVSWFQVDDYFYYAKGVASALYVILEAVHEDFHQTLETRHGIELLHHAIESCHRASEIDPWLVTDADLSGILANHRANMAAPVSHARFYLDVLIATLST